MKKKIGLLCLVVPLVFTSALLAQFVIPGVPQVVIDPSAIVKIGEELTQLYKEYEMLQQTYATTVNTYKRLESNAQQITDKDSWRYIATSFASPTSADGYGTSGGWMTTLNKGINAANAYDAATVRWSNPSAMTGQLSTAMRNDFGKHAATVELNDGIALNAMTVTGTARANAAAQLRALQNLQNDSLSNDPALNTEVGVLNKLNAAAVANGMASHSQIELLSVLADQNTLALKRQHDALVEEMNYSIDAAAAKQTNTDSVWAGHASARKARLP